MISLDLDVHNVFRSETIQIWDDPRLKISMHAVFASFNSDMPLVAHYIFRSGNMHEKDHLTSLVIQALSY